MKLTVYRIRKYVMYEYKTEETIDTSAFPECAGMDAAQRLRWCAENPDRVWDGDFEEWLTGYAFDHSREGDATVFLHGETEDGAALMCVDGAVFEADDIGDKYPRTPDDDEVAAAREKMEAALSELRKKAKPAPKPERNPQPMQETTTLQRETHPVNGQTFELVHCPPGTFTMGCPEDEAGREEGEEQHEVTLTHGFAMGVVPVTQALWEAVTGENPSNFKDGLDAPQRPVEKVSWFDAVRFCNALSAKLGLLPAYTIGEGDEPAVSCDFGASGFRLPTEAEWDYAVRSGGDSFVYAGSDNLDEVGWCNENSDNTTQPVAGKGPTRWGLHDLSGNVWEWCWDDVDGYYDPLRVARGGSWFNTAVSARAAYRGRYDAGNRRYVLGFRLSRMIA